MNACRFIVYPCLSVINAPLYSLTYKYRCLYLTLCGAYLFQGAKTGVLPTKKVPGMRSARGKTVPYVLNVRIITPLKSPVRLLCQYPLC